MIGLTDFPRRLVVDEDDLTERDEDVTRPPMGISQRLAQLFGPGNVDIQMCVLGALAIIFFLVAAII